jgi:hypothetical protein
LLLAVLLGGRLAALVDAWQLCRGESSSVVNSPLILISTCPIPSALMLHLLPWAALVRKIEVEIEIEIENCREEELPS